MALFVAATIVLCCQSQLILETPHVVVSHHGIGDFKTITGAILAAPTKSVRPQYIKIKKGTYREYNLVYKNKTNIVLIGEGMGITKIMGNRNFYTGNKTYETATVAVRGSGFTAQDITFRNDAGPAEYQAVGLRLEADLTSFYICHLDGYQDALYVKRNCQFYLDCEICGTIDFICSSAKALFKNCLIEAYIPLARQHNIIIAQKREFKKDKTGRVLQNCTIKATRDLENMDNVTTYLGLPWGKYSRAVVMESHIDHFITPKGWIKWTISVKKPIVHRHPYFLEYKNRGPGVVIRKRVTWASRTTNQRIASNFTVRKRIHGDKWIPTNIPYYLHFSYTI